MVIILTVGLSVVSRSITSLRITKETETSQRAFSAAEAGIEKIINSSSQSLSGQLENNASYSTTVATLQGASFLINNGNPVAKGDGADVWLSHYPDYSSPLTGQITIYWGQLPEVCSSDPSLNTQAALEIVTITGSVASPVTTHYAIDPCNDRASLNNFSTSVQGGSTINGVSFAHSYQISVTDGLLMRIVPLYASTVLGISGNGVNLPSQGQVISSTGTAGTTTRKITVFKGYPKLPVEFFPSILFSY